jgi:hypothetical protein
LLSELPEDASPAARADAAAEHEASDQLTRSTTALLAGGVLMASIAGVALIFVRSEVDTEMVALPMAIPVTIVAAAVVIRRMK